jgi:hypothetical protein
LAMRSAFIKVGLKRENLSRLVKKLNKSEYSA